MATKSIHPPERRTGSSTNPAITKQTDLKLQQGIALHQAGQLEHSQAKYQEILDIDPKHAGALHLSGTIAVQLGQWERAANLLTRSLEQDDRNPFAYFNLGLALDELGRLDDAACCYGNAIKIKPDYAEAYTNRGIISIGLNQFEDALFFFEKTILLAPRNADAYLSHGKTLNLLSRFDDAVRSLRTAIALRPNSADAHYHLGIAAAKLHLFDDAILSYKKAIDLKPDYAEAYGNLGVALKGAGEEVDALENLNKAIELKPDYVEAHSNRGIVLKDLGRFDEALSSYGKAMELKPDVAEVYLNRGVALHELRRFDEALNSYETAIAFKPDYAEAYLNLGSALKELTRLDDALASYDKAIALKIGYAEAYYNRGIALTELKRLDDALASYEKAIALKLDYAEAFNNRGNALRELQRLDDALVSYEKAIALKPDNGFLLGIKLLTQLNLCNWNNLQDQLRELESSIEEKLKVTPPFAILGLADNPELHLNAARIYVNEKHPAASAFSKPESRTSNRKIRIGYYSADFHNHATSYLIAELFEAHDSQRFELYGFSFGPDTQDAMRSRVSSGFDHFFDVANKGDREVARMSRDLGIDIAVDLKGFTKDSRMGIFAQRCAPVQINYLGYPGTLAAPYFDYIVADKTLIPQESQQYYTEKIIYLPHSYQVNDSKRKISPKLFTREGLGLPESGFVFCCFNNNYKIRAETFDVWTRLLKTVSGSVLWLLEDNSTAAKNLRNEAEIRGVDSTRLVFAPRINLDEHLARHRVADLFIDTLPYNAHTTASDALWAGVPVLTRIGQSFAARVAASLLNAMDLPELITNTQEEYESRAIELANDPLQLVGIKKKLERNRETSPLFNGELFARHIEAAYAEIHRRCLSGEKPDHIDVEALMK
jgi:predicted O-linked N-acetylglucosamine transferase (SPINDLY family)